MSRAFDDLQRELLVSPLTTAQLAVLTFVRLFIEAEGAPPTRNEIAQNFGWKSATAAEDHLKALEKKGAIELRRGSARGIKVLKNAKPAKATA